MSKKKVIVISIIALAFIILLGSITIFAVSHTEKGRQQANFGERIEAALGDEYKKQTETIVAATVTYADKDENEILYYCLKTTYYEADPLEVTGLDVNALRLLFEPELARSCEEMKINEWCAALYRFDKLSYLCWTCSPETSCVLEYDPDVVADADIIKMAESAREYE